MNREIEKIHCSCGGEPTEVITTEAERRLYGCSRDNKVTSCCVMSYQCKGCTVRWVFDLAAPEME